MHCLDLTKASRGVVKSRILIINSRFGSWRTFLGRVTRLHDKVLTPFLVKDFFLCLVLYFEQLHSRFRIVDIGFQALSLRYRGWVVHVDAEKNGREPRMAPCA